MSRKNKSFITIRENTYDLLRQLKITIICGNPGSTEEPFLMNFPKDFTYILALQESSVIGIADGISQSIRKPVLVNVHTSVGTANSMGSILTAYQNKTPLIITAGNQTREMLIIEPLLTNIQPTLLPMPWVKWAYEPCCAADVPASFVRGIATAIQEPKGPVYLSIPLDDWEKPMTKPFHIRNISERQAPDPQIIEIFAQQINNSTNPIIIYGSDIARSNAWQEGIDFAEKVSAPVWSGPWSERTPFPETHPLYQGQLKSSIHQVYEIVKNHDLIIVIGAPAFRYYPYISGKYISEKNKLLLISDDPNILSKAPVGDTLLSNPKLFFDAILPKLNIKIRHVHVKKWPNTVDKETIPFSPNTILHALNDQLPDKYILTEECPSIISIMQDIIHIKDPDTFYTFSSAQLGWTMPASIGLSIGEKILNRNRPVVCLMGDGSFQYSVQSIYTGVQQKAHVIFIVFQNYEYGILKEFAVVEKIPNVPGLNLPDIDIVSLAKGYGASGIFISSLDHFIKEFNKALEFKGISVIVLPIKKVSGGLDI